MKSRHAYLGEGSKILIAVFDSLREGLVFNNKLENSIKIGEFTTLPEFCLMDIETEPVLLQNFNLSVVMEVYEITYKILNNLDEYYSFYNNNYILNENIRKKINTPYGEAYVYINNSIIKEAKIISSGDWKEYLEYKNRIETPKLKFEKLIKGLKLLLFKSKMHEKYFEL